MVQKVQLQNAIKVLKNVGTFSGLNVNEDKYVLLNIGSLMNKTEDICPDNNYKFTKGPVKFLRIMISLNHNEILSLNFEPQTSIS